LARPLQNTKQEASMKFSEKFKRNWWYLSLFVVAGLLVLRWNSIYTGTATNFDVGLLAVATALALVPIFSEFTFLGLTFKQDLENTKKELKQDIKEVQLSLRAEMQNSVNLANSVANSSQQIMYNNPPPDQVLESLTEQIVSVLKESNRNGNQQTEKINLQLPEQVAIAFSSRFFIEKELRRIWEGTYQKKAPGRGLIQLLRELVSQGIIPEPLAYSIQEVSAVASPITHSEGYTTEQIDFINNVTPLLIVALKSINHAK
jgi:hypothetical protein